MASVVSAWDGETRSVGQSIHSMPLTSTNHAVYRAYMDQVTAKVRELVVRDQVKQESAPQAVCTVVLDPAERKSIDDDFSEFRIVYPEWHRPTHALRRAQRDMINQYMTLMAQRYSSRFVHYGGRALAYLTAKVKDVHLELNASDPVALHESHEDDMDCRRLMGAAASAAARVGWQIDPDHIEEYRDRGGWMKCHDCANCFSKSGALIVDGGLYSLSPMQVMSAMRQHDCTVGFFCLPYSSNMVLEQSGYVGNSDVTFSKTEYDIRFAYPHGVSGVTRYSMLVWNQWLMQTARSLFPEALDRYEFEILSTRAGFLVVRVVHVLSPLVEMTKIHSLHLTVAEDSTLVRTWVLKGLADDPKNFRSWAQQEVIVPTRVVEKVHNYALSIPADEFTRHALRKRLSVENDRTVVQGTSVEVFAPLTSHELDVVEIALYTHCFVQRYEAGQLTKHLMSVVNNIAGFGSLSLVAKMASVMVAATRMVYDYSLGPVNDMLRDALDRAVDWLCRRPSFQNEFLPMPHFVRYTSIIRSQAVGFMQFATRICRLPPHQQDVDTSFGGVRFLAYTKQIAVEEVPIKSFDTSGKVITTTGSLFSDYIDTSEGSYSTAEGRALVSKYRQLNEMSEPGYDRQLHSQMTVEIGVNAPIVHRSEYQYDPGFISTLSDLHDAIFPGMASQEFIYDPASISTDHQDRTLAAEYLQLPSHFGDMPGNREVFRSKVKAYEVTARPMTLQETLSGFVARNMSAPVVALPQDDVQLVHSVWNDFLDIACVPGARQKIAEYKRVPVGLEEQGVFDWVKKANPDKVAKVLKYLTENPEAWQEFDMQRFDSMIKSDVKPPLSDKPLYSRIEPQMIVHYMPHINALFSAVFRILVRNLLALLKPNFVLNLLKDMTHVRDVIQTNHPWGEPVQFLENDFSKYDKSQNEFVHLLEAYVFEQLGMNEEMLKHWSLGHIDTSIRSLATGISLSVRYQRKSGDATTSFGNGLLNIMSVLHAYKGSDIVWGVFMGDDSLVCTRRVVQGEVAIQALAEKFNLIAKFYITDSPYFASNFVLINQNEMSVSCVPDPVKRAEKFSMAVTAVNPQWHERYISSLDSLKVYMNRANLVGLAEAVRARYSLSEQFNVEAITDAIASAIRTEDDFRSMWEKEPVVIRF